MKELKYLVPSCTYQAKEIFTRKHLFQEPFACNLSLNLNNG
jgi:hypothetical protein